MEKTLTRIGAICVNFETLDLALSACIGRLISDDAKIGAIMTADLPYSSLVHAFSSLIKYKFTDNPNFIEEVDKIIKILNESEVSRNQIIHSNYAFNDFENDTNDVTRIKITSRQKKGLTIDTVIMTETHLREINEKIVFATQQLHCLYSSLFKGEQIKYA